MRIQVKNYRKLRGLLRDFSINVKAWESAIYHQVKPDEIYNAPLIAILEYGDADMAHCVLACAGVDSPEQPIESLTITMPTWSTYINLVRLANGE